MTQLKHTPGPWRIGDAGHTVFGPPNGNPSPQTIAHNLTRANARLIAAAPELYMLLSDAREAALNEDINDVLAILSGDICSEVIEKLRG